MGTRGFHVVEHARICAREYARELLFFISLSFSGGARQTSSQIANGRVLAPQHKNDQLLLKGKSKEGKDDGQ